MIHPLKAIQATWNTFWGIVSEGVRADSEGMGLKGYHEDMVRYQAFSALKKLNPAVVEALQESAARLFYKIVMLEPDMPNFETRLLHLHAQVSFLTKGLLTEIINAEAYLKITQKELSRIEAMKKQQTAPMTPRP